AGDGKSCRHQSVLAGMLGEVPSFADLALCGIMSICSSRSGRRRPMLRSALRAAVMALVMAPMLGPPASAQRYKLRVATVGVPPSMHTLYMQVAFEEGIYARNGLAVDELLPLAAGPLVTQALLSGRIDVAETDAEGI